MKLGHIELFVRDPGASLAFYRDALGFELVTVQDGGRCIWVRLQDMEFLLRQGTPPAGSPTYGQARVGFVLYAADAKARMARMKEAGVVFHQDSGAGGDPVFADPDGHWFQLVDPEGS